MDKQMDMEQGWLKMLWEMFSLTCITTQVAQSRGMGGRI